MCFHRYCNAVVFFFKGYIFNFYVIGSIVEFESIFGALYGTNLFFILSLSRLILSPKKSMSFVGRDLNLLCAKRRVLPFKQKFPLYWLIDNLYNILSCIYLSNTCIYCNSGSEFRMFKSLSLTDIAIFFFPIL